MKSVTQTVLIVASIGAFAGGLAWAGIGGPTGDPPNPVVAAADGDGQPAIKPAQVQDKAGAEVDFPFVIAFERGDTKFEPGDEITITEVRGTSSDMESGICRIAGTYNLASQDSATLAASVSASEMANARGPWNRAQTMKIARGRGTFKLLLPISIKGWPHVSFYGKSSSFGGIYIGTGEWVLRSR